MLKNSWVCRLWLLWETSPTALIFLDFCHCGCCHFCVGGLRVSDSKHILYLLELKAANLLGHWTSDTSEKSIVTYRLWRIIMTRSVIFQPESFSHCFNGETLMLLYLLYNAMLAKNNAVILKSTWNTFATHFTSVMRGIYIFFFFHFTIICTINYGNRYHIRIKKIIIIAALYLTMSV